MRTSLLLAGLASLFFAQTAAAQISAPPHGAQRTPVGRSTLSLSAQALEAEPLLWGLCSSTSLHTGTDSGGVMATGSVDPDWTITSNAGGSAQDAYVQNYAYWATAPSDCAWIGPSSTGNGSGAVGSYTYELDFDLDMCECRDFKLRFSYAVDDHAMFLLNGTPFFAGTGSGHTSIQGPFTLTGLPFVNGTNTLTVFVENDIFQTGLLICADVLAYQRVPELQLNMGTGNSGNTPVGPGNSDPDWFINTGFSSSLTFQVTPNVSWDPDTAPYGARWITSTNWGTSAPGSEGAGTTTYERVFSLDTQLFDIQPMTLRYASDNSVQFFLNGTPIGGGTGFTSLQTISGITGFQDGYNVLQAVVTNFGGPTGLLVSGKLYGYYKDNPSIDLSTGTTGGTPNNHNGFGTPGDYDPEWRLIAGPGVTSPSAARTVTPVSSYVTSTAANWINGPGLITSTGVGTFVYETQFTVDTANFENHVLNFEYSMDDMGDIALIYPDSSVAVLHTTGAFSAFTSFWGPSSVSLTMPGTYRLQARVTNEMFLDALLVIADLTMNRRCDG